MKTKTTLLFLTFILFACAQNFSTPETLPAQVTTITPFIQPATKSAIDVPTDSNPSGPKIVVTVGTPNIGQSPDGDFPTPAVSQQQCGFTWAYHDLPEITTEFDTAVKALNSSASAHATAFGEDCFGPDGQFVRFAAMETDFYVTMPASDLSDYESFGNIIAQVLQIVTGFPPDTLAGPKPGFVEFRFEKSASESIGLRVPIEQYKTTAHGITGEELLRMFYTGP
ncbi:MAG: hypothetical protein IPP66_20715 [Anaerolineales bacterium]|nr:hypothetical protein [Anaerolineales bacterium]